MKLTTLAIAASAAFSIQATAADLEVLHYWTSGGEALSAAALKTMMQDKGHTWKDFAVAGGGGDNAMTVLKSRVMSGNAPAAAQIKGPAIQEWAMEGVLGSLDDVAKAENWDAELPSVIADIMKYKASYVAAPVNVHRVNWLWASPDALAKAGVNEMPKSFDEFFTAADKLKAAGLIAVAHGGQPWQDFTTFETVVLGIGGAAFYRDALVELDQDALTSDTMKTALNTFRRIKTYTDPASPGRDWNLATAMLTQGKAGFQFMGDWAKGELIAAGKVPGQDFLCAPAPGTSEAFTFNVDSFAMFKLASKDGLQAQTDLASALMSPTFQEVFNLNKGSIPVRLNMDMSKFDECGKLSASDFAAAAKRGTLVPSIAHGMAVSPSAEGSIKDAVSQFWNDDRISVDEAVKRIADAARMI